MIEAIEPDGPDCGPQSRTVVGWPTGPQPVICVLTVGSSESRVSPLQETVYWDVSSNDRLSVITGIVAGRSGCRSRFRTRVRRFAVLRVHANLARPLCLPRATR
jgi:hypothetical protein